MFLEVEDQECRCHTPGYPDYKICLASTPDQNRPAGLRLPYSRMDISGLRHDSDQGTTPQLVGKLILDINSQQYSCCNHPIFHRRSYIVITISQEYKNTRVATRRKTLLTSWGSKPVQILCPDCDCSSHQAGFPKNQIPAGKKHRQYCLHEYATFVKFVI